MKHLSDDEITTELENLDQQFTLTSDRKEYIKQRVFSTKHSHRVKKIKNHWLPSILSFALVMIVFSSMYFYLSSNQGSIGSSTIVDVHTPEKLPEVIPSDTSIFIEWGSDSMDRGNDEFITIGVERIGGERLVVETTFGQLERGQAIYYETPPVKLDIESNISDKMIGRVIGLPGETVEIKAGQVYIDDKMLDTFYGKATMHGFGEEEYFKMVHPRVYSYDKEEVRKYFNMNMSKVHIDESSVFILVDQWWRGIDSRYFGPLPIEKVKGIIVGHEKQ